MGESLRVCVVGASGYAGVELCRLIVGHPTLRLSMATDRKLAGTRLADLYPELMGICDITFSLPDPASIATRADIAFLAVPHTAALELAPALLTAGVTVIDLSADYRLRDPGVYEEWYGVTHTSPELLTRTVYALPEVGRKGLARLAERHGRGEAVLVSMPGCYPTATTLAVAPALSAGLVADDQLIVSAISGVSGAGRGANARTHFCHANESVEPYGVASHRHTPEIEQVLSDLAGREVGVVFVPHLAPLTRGLLSTVYAGLRPGIGIDEVRTAYQTAYADEPLVTLLPDAHMPATGSVAGTARAHVGVALDLRRHPTLIAACAIDNLGKGAASQAVQAANIVCGLDETAGLALPMPVI